MAKNGLNIEVRGVKAAIQRTKNARDELIRGIAEATERAALAVANDAADNAPRLHGYLRNSIIASPRKVNALKWTVGSDLPYAARQEYEHKSRKGFFRKALAKESPLYEKAIKDVIRRVK